MPSNSSPFSYVRYESSGSAGPYSINFDYLSSSHLSVSLNGVTQATSAYTIDTNANTVTFNSAPAAGVVIVIERSTPKGKSAFQTDVADFSDGSVLTAEDLDQAALGLLYVAQEADDSGNANSLNKDLQDEKWDASNTTIKNVPLPASSLDAVNKDYVDGLSLYNSPTPLQVYTFTGNTTDTAFVMSPAPQSADPKAFIVDVGGVAQRPTTDYTISGSTITFGTAPPAATITVRNIGVARDTLAQPIVADGTANNSLTVKAINSQTSKLQEWQNTSGVAQASIATDGDAVFKDVAATGNISGVGVTASGNISGVGVTASGDISGVNVTASGTVTSAGALTASGLLNVVGALQFNGQTGIKIHGITKFDLVDANGQGTTNSAPSPSATNSSSVSDANYVLSGIRATITPQSSSSKFLVLGSINGAAGVTGALVADQKRAGVYGTIILNNTPSNGRGNIHNGTRIGAQYKWLQYVTGPNFVHGSIPIQTIYEPASTNQFTLDVAFQSYYESSASILTSESRAILGNRFVVAIEFSS